jgi:tetratricopeptide (TPR) repeat protein
MKTGKITLFIFLCCFNISNYSQSSIFINARKNFDEGKFDESKKMFNLIGKNSNEYAESRCYLGKIYYFEKNLDEAIKSFEEAVKANNKNAEYYFMLGNMQGEKAMKANIVQQALLAKDILKSWETGAKLDSMHQGIRWGLMNFYTMAPSFMGGGMDKAYKMADELNRIKYPEGFEAKGYVYERDKKNDLAEKSFKEAIKANPKESKYYHALAYFYIRHNGKDKAQGLFEKALEINPDDARSTLELGKLFSENITTIDKGKTYLDRFFQIADKNNKYELSRANFYLGNIYKFKGDKTNARKCYESTLSLNPKFEEAKKELKELK